MGQPVPPVSGITSAQADAIIVALTRIAVAIEVSNAQLSTVATSLQTTAANPWRR